MIENIYQKWCDAGMQISTDTRKLKQNSIFFALKGENFNGNRFAVKALENGCSYAIIDEKLSHSEAFEGRLIVVEDVLETLQSLASFHRAKMPARIICLTGSNGKTTTKELIHKALSTKYDVLATEGNLNNHIGVPLTLLNLRDTHDFGIVELGANHQGEIRDLAKIAQPDMGYITNFGKAHLEGFGGIEGVIKGKSELYDYLRANDKIALINTSDEKQVKQSKGIVSLITFDPNQSRVLHTLSLQPNIVMESNGRTYKSPLFGSYNFINICAAFAIANHFQIEADQALMAISNYNPDNNRSQIIRIENTEVILDAYNANPSSVLNAIDNFKHREGNKCVVLGDMFELGDDAVKEHKEVIRYLENIGIDAIYIGELFAQAKSTGLEKITVYKTKKDLLSDTNFKDLLKNYDSVLVKGSRGMKMESLIE